MLTLGGTWLALLGWQPGALRERERDRWIDWSLQQKLRRLDLTAQNVRFVILPGAAGRKNLESRVLDLSLCRLSADILGEHGYPALLAKTLVDRALHKGTCYRAENWRARASAGVRLGPLEPARRGAPHRRYPLASLLRLTTSAHMAGYRDGDGLVALCRPAQPAAAGGHRPLVQQ